VDSGAGKVSNCLSLTPNFTDLDRVCLPAVCLMPPTDCSAKCRDDLANGGLQRLSSPVWEIVLEFSLDERKRRETCHVSRYPDNTETDGLPDIRHKLCSLR
jgi:hypothetical protein